MKVYRECRNRLMTGMFVVMMAVAAVSCGNGGRVQELILLHTNDSHGSVMAIDSVGGLAERATFVRQVREAHGQVLLVDAGDINAGQPVSNMADAKPDILAYNYMGYDAVAAGNHEFDKPVDVLKTQMKMVEFPFLTSNIEQDGEPLGELYLIKEYGGVKVGLFGVTTVSTQNLSVGAAQLTFLNEAETARRMVKLLRGQKVDIIIALTHLGFTETTPDFLTSVKLAEQVDGIDIIVDGHSHSYIDKPLRVNNTWIVTASQGGRYFGEGKMEITGGRLSGFDWKPVKIKGFAPDTVLKAELFPYISEAEKDLQTEIGVSLAPFDVYENGVNVVRRKENALGGLVTDAMAWKAGELGIKADFALINSGGIRAGLPEGKIVKNDILTTLPFANVLEIVAMKGSDVRQLFDFIATIGEGVGSFPQLSKEVRVKIDRQAQKIVSLTIGGKEVDDEAVYYMATCDYIAAGKDGYENALKHITNKENTSLNISDVVMQYIRYKGRITPLTEGRIVFTALSGE